MTSTDSLAVTVAVASQTSGLIQHCCFFTAADGFLGGGGIEARTGVDRLFIAKPCIIYFTRRDVKGPSSVSVNNISSGEGGAVRGEESSVYRFLLHALNCFQ